LIFYLFVEITPRPRANSLAAGSAEIESANQIFPIGCTGGIVKKKPNLLSHYECLAQIRLDFSVRDLEMLTRQIPKLTIKKSDPV